MIVVEGDADDVSFLAIDADRIERMLYPIPEVPEMFLTIGFVGAKVAPSFNFEVRLVR